MSLIDRIPPEQNHPIMLDSGAFTAWTKKVVIDIDDYIEFIHKYKPYLNSYVNLDVIPAEFGRKATPQEVKESAQKSFENFLYMRDNGLDPIPVFHYGEDFKWLEAMVDAGCEYIGISPTTDKTTAQKRAWLDKVFEFITDSEGRAIVKTHAFGVTGVSLLVRYPWYSADATTWVRASSFGAIIVPVQDARGVSDYQKRPIRIYVSGGASQLDKEGAHYETSSPALRKAIDEYLEGLSLGYTYEDLKGHYTPRDEVNILYYKALEKNLKAKALDTSSIQPDFFKPVRDFKMPGSLMKLNIIFATGYDVRRNSSLTQCQANNRLISYYYHESDKVKEEFIPRLTKHGMGRPFEKFHRIKLRGNAI
ncbi:MAG: hypothetical protein KAR06_00395 [Deltaproteobacteria bacterium]|nr:hypothetical protein [Deltaproteobacteria bacterium]